MPGGKFDLSDYVDVKERVRLFLAQYPDGRLVTAKVRVTREPDDTPRVWVKAAAYRTADDPHPAIGWSWRFCCARSVERFAPELVSP